MKQKALFPFDIEKDWVPVFMSGAYPQLVSDTNPIGMADGRLLGDVVQSYNLQQYAAPVTVDHLQEGPRFGTVESLKVEGGKLFAKFRNVLASFIGDLKDGKLLYPSIELYDPQHSGNPAPGQWYLKAVTFLGAQAPQVKGLYSGFSEAFIFSDDKGKVVCLSQFNKETENTMTPEEIKALIAGEVAVFHEKIATLETENASLKASAAARDEAALQAQKAASEKSVAEFCGRMKSEGRYTPAFADGQMKTDLTTLITNPAALSIAMTAYEKGSEKGKLFNEQTHITERDGVKLSESQNKKISQFAELAKTESVIGLDVATSAELRFNELVKQGAPPTYETRKAAYHHAFAEKGASA